MVIDESDATSGAFSGIIDGVNALCKALTEKNDKQTLTVIAFSNGDAPRKIGTQNEKMGANINHLNI